MSMLTSSSGAAGNESAVLRNYVTASKKGAVYQQANKMKNNGEEMGEVESTYLS